MTHDMDTLRASYSQESGWSREVIGRTETYNIIRAPIIREVHVQPRTRKPLCPCGKRHWTITPCSVVP